MAGNKSFATESLEQNANLRNEVASSDLFETLKNGLKKLSIDGQELYVAEGDTLLDEDQLRIYAFSRQKLNEARNAAEIASALGLGVTGLAETQRDALVAVTQGGKIVRWAPGVTLSYRVVRNTFTSQENYDTVVAAMAAATEAWEGVCGVKFQHRAELDGNSGVDPAGALFSVRELNAEGMFIAAAFFPNDPVDRRRVVIDPSFFTLRDPPEGFDKVGVLRHELGHVLGFRHEHIRSQAPPACPDEPLFDTRNLGAYDPRSVMHYFCGGVGSRELRITDIDRQGSQSVYGPPISQVLMVEA
jgi:hypothetical protein